MAKAKFGAKLMIAFVVFIVLFAGITIVKLVVQAIDLLGINRSSCRSVRDKEKKNYVTRSMDAPPSFRPSKKFSDVSGLESKYTDPQTKLNYSSTQEFKIIRKLPSDIVAGYLTLRKANIQLQ
jgi:hypothetical protein